MRIMLDTNVLLSAILFPGEKMNRMMQCIFEKHRLVLSSFVIDELSYVVERKFPTKAKAVDALLANMSFELVYRSNHPFGIPAEGRQRSHDTAP